MFEKFLEKFQLLFAGALVTVFASVLIANEPLTRAAQAIA